MMKGFIKGQSIILLETLPQNLEEGDEVDISITVLSKKSYPFPRFKLGVKAEYLTREKIYESD